MRLAFRTWEYFIVSLYYKPIFCYFSFLAWLLYLYYLKVRAKCSHFRQHSLCLLHVSGMTILSTALIERNWTWTIFLFTNLETWDRTKSIFHRFDVHSWAHPGHILVIHGHIDLSIAAQPMWCWSKYSFIRQYSLMAINVELTFNDYICVIWL